MKEKTNVTVIPILATKEVNQDNYLEVTMPFIRNSNEGDIFIGYGTFESLVKLQQSTGCRLNIRIKERTE